MKTPRLPILLAILLLALILLIGCAGSSVSPSDKTSEAQTNNETALYEKGDDEFDDAGAGQAEYNVVFNLNYSGASPIIQKVAAGSAVSKPASPARNDEYSFENWYTDRACTVPFDFSSAVNSNTVLFAGWSSGKVTVSFNYNYVGAPALEKIGAAKGGSIERPADPTREHYAFDGWYTEAGDKFDFAGAIDANVTLYAHWTLTDATVTFNYGFDGAPEDTKTTVTVGGTVTAPSEVPTRTEYDFAGWFDGDGAAFDFSSPVNSDLTLTAHWSVKQFTFTYDWNGYAGTPEKITVSYSETATEPENTRSGYVCAWKYNGEDYDFSTPVTGDMTITAEWTKESTDSVTMTYYYNFDGAPNGGVYLKQTVKLKYRPALPEAPIRAIADGVEYFFEGWYADADCTVAYNFNTRLTENTSAYAHWLVKYTFEAEYTDLDGKEGRGYSSNTSGTQLIKKDNGTANASNGFYVSDLYYNGSEIKFVIVSDRAVDDAIVIIRVQAEHYDMEFTTEVYEVAVNGTALDYTPFTLQGGEADIRTDDRRPFIDIQMNVKASLKAGENEITLTAIADHDFDVGGRHSGTMKAIAPMIDCIYVCTDAALTWTPKTSNLADK